jgi:putative ABC transport system ATP-binding protein
VHEAAGATDAPAILITDLRFAYGAGPAVLDIPTLRIERGERVFVFGPSGSGKTTLLGVLAGVRRADTAARCSRAP